MVITYQNFIKSPTEIIFSLFLAQENGGLLNKVFYVQNQFGTAMATTSLLSLFICWLMVDQLQLFDEHSSLWIAVCLLFGLSKPPNTNRSPWISTIAWRSVLFGMKIGNTCLNFQMNFHNTSADNRCSLYC